MMLEKITIKPPINKIVEILLVILCAKISPKLEKVTVFLSCLKAEAPKKEEELFLFRFQ